MVDATPVSAGRAPYLRRKDVPSLDGGAATPPSRLSTSSAAAVAPPASSSRASPTPSPRRAAPPPPSSVSLGRALSSPSSQARTHQLQPDPPLASLLPSYPPPPVPTRASASTTFKKDALAAKRDAYLHHKERLAAHHSGVLARHDPLAPVPAGKGKAKKAVDEREPLLSDPIPTTTWSLASELDYLDLPKATISRARLDASLVEPFSTDAIPAPRRLWEAGMCEVVDEMGLHVKFRDLISKAPGRKTVIYFIRHFWCGQCQDYMQNSIPELDPEIMKKLKIDVIIVSNGHWQIIKKYREIMKCPWPIFVDGPRRLYNFLGMTRLNNDFGTLKQADRPKYNQRTVPSQLAHGIGNGLFRMPIRDPGKLTQLGGEFVFGPANVCHFAHRMSNTSDHMEAVEVLVQGAGVDPDIFYPGESGTTSIFDAPKRKRITTVQQQEVNERLVREAKQAELVAAQEAEWQCDWELRREAELDRIRRKKLERRAGRLRESGGGVGADRAYDSPSPEEVAAAMAQEIEDAEAKRPWTEEEQEAALADALSCARIDDSDPLTYTAQDTYSPYGDADDDTEDYPDDEYEATSNFDSEAPMHSPPALAAFPADAHAARTTTGQRARYISDGEESLRTPNNVLSPNGTFVKPSSFHDHHPDERFAGFGQAV